MKMNEKILEADEGSSVSCGALWEDQQPVNYHNHIMPLNQFRDHHISMKT